MFLTSSLKAQKLNSPFLDIIPNKKVTGPSQKWLPDLEIDHPRIQRHLSGKVKCRSLREQYDIKHFDFVSLTATPHIHRAWERNNPYSGLLN